MNPSKVSVLKIRKKLLLHPTGTYPGGRNIKNRESMGGQRVEIEDDGIPSGQPLYWTVEATNTGSKRHLHVLHSL